MASRAMVRVTGGARSGAAAIRDLDDHLAAVVVPARLTDVVRQLELAAVRTFAQIDRPQPMVRPAHVAPGLGNFLPRNRHSFRPRVARPSSPRVLFPQLSEGGERLVRLRLAQTDMGAQGLGLNSRSADRSRVGIER